MKKLGLCSVLVAATIFSGCGDKNVDLETPNANSVTLSGSNSESALNSIPNSGIEVNDGSFSLGEKADGGVYYTINGKRVFIANIYFGFDQYNLNSTQKAKAVLNAEKLSAVNKDATVKVSGNTDEWGTDEYNYALGLKRAKAVKDVLSANGVVANISLISFGESNPVCTVKTQACWQKNRRVEHSLVK